MTRNVALVAELATGKCQETANLAAARMRVIAENVPNDRARKALFELAEGHEQLHRKLLFFAALRA